MKLKSLAPQHNSPMRTKIVNCQNTRRWTESSKSKCNRLLFVSTKVLSLLQCLHFLLTISVPHSINVTTFQNLSRFLLIFITQNKSGTLQKYCRVIPCYHGDVNCVCVCKRMYPNAYVKFIKSSTVHCNQINSPLPDCDMQSHKPRREFSALKKMFKTIMQRLFNVLTL